MSELKEVDMPGQLEMIKMLILILNWSSKDSFSWNVCLRDLLLKFERRIAFTVAHFIMTVSGMDCQKDGGEAGKSDLHKLDLHHHFLSGVLPCCST